MVKRSCLCAAWLFCSVASAQNTTNPSAPYVADSLTAALYHFDEAAGDTAYDASPKKLNGIVHAARIGVGRFGAAVVLNGSNNVILTPPSATTDAPNATFEAWIYIDSVSTGYPMAVIDRFAFSERTGRGLYISEARKVVAYATADPGFRSEAQSAEPVPVNTWVHVAAIFNENAGRLTVMVNGVRTGEAPMGCCTTTGAHELAVGRYAPFQAFFFRGMIDEVRISRSARGLIPVSVESRSWTSMKALWQQQ